MPAKPLAAILFHPDACHRQQQVKPEITSKPALAIKMPAIYSK